MVFIAAAVLLVVMPAVVVADTADTETETLSGRWSLEISWRDENAWDVRSKDIKKFNQRDCIDNVRMTFKATLSAEAADDSRKTYLVVGSNCKSSFDGCTVVFPGKTANTSLIWKDVHLQTLFPDNDCNTGDTQELWLGQLDSDLTYNESNGDVMSRVMTIGLDVTGPNTVPRDIEARIGNENIEQSWANIEDADVAGFVAIYWSPEDGPLALSGASGDTETDSTLATDSDAADFDSESPALDTSVLSSCPVAGGFSAGDRLDPLLISGTAKALGTTSSSLRSMKITGLQNGRAYNVAVVSVDASGNPSRISSVQCAVPQPTSGLGDAYEDALDGGYCFVATAAFASYSHPTVQVLRRFRDQFISPLPGGKVFISGYYAVGPAMARFLSRRSEDAVKNTRRGLTLSAANAELLMSVGAFPVMIASFFSLLIGLLLGFRTPALLRRNR